MARCSYGHGMVVSRANERVSGASQPLEATCEYTLVSMEEICTKLIDDDKHNERWPARIGNRIVGGLSG